LTQSRHNHRKIFEGFERLLKGKLHPQGENRRAASPRGNPLGLRVSKARVKKAFF